MSATEKFQFRTNFDEPSVPVAAAELEEEVPPPPSFSEEELEAARQEALALGQAQGRDEAQQALERVSADCLGIISRQLERIEGDLEGRLNRIERDSLLAALAIVRKLFPALARREELLEIEAVLKDCLQRLHNEPRIAVRLSEAMLDALSPRIEAISKESGFEGRLVLLADPGFQLSEVKVEWADGGAERNSERMWAEIEARLCDSIKRSSPGAAGSRAAQSAPDQKSAAASGETPGQALRHEPADPSPEDQQGLPQ